MDNEVWSRDLALAALKDNLYILDGDYDDEREVFFDVRYEGEGLVANVTDATDDTRAEEFIISFQ